MKVFKLVVILFFFVINVFGQQVEQFIPDPNAVSLMTPVEIPASHYTGTPNISIPLYTVKFKNFSMPISIAYQASGIQVAQESSVIGLGWSLNAGGSISRVIRGYNDFLGGELNGYTNGTFPVESDCYFAPYADIIKEPISPDIYARPNTLSGVSLSELFEDYTECNIDGKYVIEQDMEPDIFTYSFCGYSGKFFMKDKNEFVFIDNNNLKFIGDPNEEIISIQDSEGIIYRFSEGTRTRSYSKYLKERDSNLEDEISTLAGGTISKERGDVSTWNLETITLPEGDVISFDYEGNTSYKSHVRVSQTQSMNLPAEEAFKLRYYLNEMLCYARSDDEYKYCYSFQVYEQEKVLKRINFGNHKIEFDHGERIDLRNYDNNESGNQIRIKGFKLISNNETLKTVSFYNNSYFNESTKNTIRELDLRLKLDSVKIDNLPVYSFEYNDDEELPVKNSPSFDQWGYFNGASNKTSDGKNEIHSFVHYDGLTTIRHMDDPFNPLEVVSFIMEGADRNPNDKYAKTSILEEIVYPTGGSRKFYYGLNDIYNASGHYVVADSSIDSFEPIDPSEQYDPDSNGFMYFTDTETPFTIITKQKVKFFGGVLINAHREPYVGTYIYAQLINAINGDIIASIAYDGIEYSKIIDLFLEPGDYILKTSGDGYCGYGAAVHFYYEEYKPGPPAENVGGLRIERIEEADGKTRLFDYTSEDGKSSGVLLSQPEYVSVYSNGGCDANGPMNGFEETWNNEEYELGEPNAWESNAWNYTINAQRRSSTIRPLVGANGQSVGYSRVKEMLVSAGGDTSQTIYYFKNKAESYRSYMLPNLPNIAVLSNGLVNSIEYRKNSELIRKEKYLYEKDTNRSYEYLACRQDIETYNLMFYKNSNQWWKLREKETIDYYPNGNVKTKELFEYNADNFQVNKHKTFNNEERAVVKEIKYPNDYSSSVSESLIANNLVTRPIDSRTYKGSTLISGSQTKYNENGKPISVFSFESDSEISFSESTPFTFKNKTNISYYDNGRIRDISEKNNITTSYAWAYNNEYPVVKIESSSSNVGIDAIQLALNDMALSGGNSKSDIDDDIALLKSALPELDGMVSLFTYKPLVGITSKTDPRGRTTYYIYDDYGRLKHVLNHDGNIMDELEYQYGSQNQ